MKKVCYFPVVCLIIPLDYVLWNLNLVPTFGYSVKSLRQIIVENWKAYKEKTAGKEKNHGLYFYDMPRR